MKCTGSGIYAGRLGALKIIVNQTAMTTVLIAKVPADPRSYNAHGTTQSQSSFIANPVSINEIHSPYSQETNRDLQTDEHFAQDDMSVFAIKFLDFSKKLYHDGMVCQEGICCYYDIAINRNHIQVGKVC